MDYLRARKGGYCWFDSSFVMQWPQPVKKERRLRTFWRRTLTPSILLLPKLYQKGSQMHHSEYYPAVWHENKAGNISSYPYSCALRAGASYNYLLVNGERRLTPREMLRLQGFPDSFEIVVSDCQTRKQAGNAVPVDMIKLVLDNFIPLVFRQ